MSAVISAESTFNAFAPTLADVLEQNGFNHQNTINDVEEIWSKTGDHDSTLITIDYVTGSVVIEKYDSADRLKTNETKNIKLNAPSALQTAVRYSL